MELPQCRDCMCNGRLNDIVDDSIWTYYCDGWRLCHCIIIILVFFFTQKTDKRQNDALVTIGYLSMLGQVSAVSQQGALDLHTSKEVWGYNFFYAYIYTPGWKERSFNDDTREFNPILPELKTLGNPVDFWIRIRRNFPLLSYVILVCRLLLYACKSSGRC